MASIDSPREQAKNELDRSLKLGTFCMRQFGLSFEPEKTTYAYMRNKIMLGISFLTIIYHLYGDFAYISITVANSPKVEDVVPLFHTFGYGILSIVKLFAIWSKREVFGKLLRELVDIWPVESLEPADLKIKEKSLVSLQFVHKWYFAVNVAGLIFYNVTPIGIFFLQKWQGLDEPLGFVWTSWYPFDKHKPMGHFLVYLFEFFVGLTCVWAMTGSDLLFTAVASHICMLLRLLHRRLSSLAAEGLHKSEEEHFSELIQNIKLHQRLIIYCNELEKAFTFVNLVNIIMSSVNICCVVFVIVLLEPLLKLSNKIFLAWSLMQIFIICWYSEDIFHANADVGMHAYNSGWWRMSPRYRRTLQFMIARSQKTIALTAMNFTNINLNTYSAIMTRSYSYFALLYTMYTE